MKTEGTAMKKDLIHRLEALESASAPLEPSTEQRHRWMQELIGHTDEFIASLPGGIAYSPNKAMKNDLGIHDKQRSLTELLAIYREDVEANGVWPASGGHLGYIPGGGIYTSAMADYLAAVSNEYAGIFFGSPGAVNIENEVLDWLKKVFGFPASAVGNLPSGGSIANLIALTAARDKHGIKGAKVEQAVIYLSRQVHHCIYKALRIIGLEDVQMRFVELDARHRMDADDLREKLAVDRASGLQPFLVIASAGTTDTGAVAPLDTIADIAQSNDLWFHVDGAYGGFFILVNRLKPLFKGIERADSLVVDPHKGLFMPYGVGAVLVKDRESVLRSHHYFANYMQDAMRPELPTSPADVSPELTKHFRGLRVWLPLQLHGIEPFTACLEEKLLLTEYFRNGLIEMGFEVGPEPDLSVSYFWYPAKDRDPNEFNRQLLERLHRDGRVFLSSTMIDNRFVIRMAILAFRTKKATIDKALAMVSDALKSLE